MIKNSYKVIGVMSGTSLDGIDIIYANLNYANVWSFKILHSKTVPYSIEWKRKLSSLTKLKKNKLNEIDIDYSNYLANTILSFIDSYSIKEIDFVSSHGHTALHQPEKGITFQMGNQNLLSDKLGLKVICDFRIQDVMLGGQGAPLVPIGDIILFSDYKYCINLGGFANVSFDNDNRKRIAFDICPVNIVLNHYVKTLGFEYDDKGKLAASGVVNHKLLDELNQLNYYQKEPPKSLGLEWVESVVFPIINNYTIIIEDILRTFVEHVAFQVSAVLTEINTKALITGGGAFNTFLIERIKHFSNVDILLPEEDIINYKEALIFALLGVLKDRNEINCLSSVTGASKNHSSGKILLPKISR